MNLTFGLGIYVGITSTISVLALTVIGLKIYNLFRPLRVIK